MCASGEGGEAVRLTKEQLEREIRIWSRRRDAEGIIASSFALDVMRLALRGLERDERAERIGRAVLATGIAAEMADRIARDLRSAIGNLRLSSPAGGRTLEPMEVVLRAIADAMREETP